MSVAYIVIVTIGLQTCLFTSHHFCTFQFKCFIPLSFLILRLVVQRTKKIDECQELLLQMIETLTTGTEEESMDFMAICVDTLRGFPRNDTITPIFVIERLCNIIRPVSYVEFSHVV